MNPRTDLPPGARDIQGNPSEFVTPVVATV
jgi:hypothetical protein